MIFAVASLGIGGYMSVEYYSIHTLVLDPVMKQYSVYRGEVLIVTQHCHNIYVRLMSKKPGTAIHHKVHSSHTYIRY